ncbi:MAG: hypothetical protein ABJK25_13645 [Halieaceae bacterium]
MKTLKGYVFGALVGAVITPSVSAENMANQDAAIKSTSSQVHKVAVMLASQDATGTNQAGYKWGSEAYAPSHSSNWKAAAGSTPGYKWDKNDIQRKGDYAGSTGYKWNTVNQPTESGYRWRAQNTPEVAGYRWRAQ